MQTLDADAGTTPDTAPGTTPGATPGPTPGTTPGPHAALEAELACALTWLAQVIHEVGEPAVAATLTGLTAPVPTTVADPEHPDPKPLIQALAIAFHLMRLVEARHEAQARHAARLRGDARAFAGTFDDHLARLADLPAEAIARAFHEARVEPVFTAHPTEAKRQTVLEHHRDLAAGLAAHAALAPADPARVEAADRVRATLERLWRTGDIHLDKPDVAAERRAVRHYLSEVFPVALPAVRARLRAAWRAANLPGEPPTPAVRFGSWVGGDRDGHPLVTAEVTAQALRELRADALAGLRSDLERAARRLSLSALLEAPSPALTAHLAARAEALGPSGSAALARNPDEPWRGLLNLALAGLAAAGATPPGPGAATPETLAEDLQVLTADLRQRGAHRLIDAELAPLQDRLQTFGFHTAKLDIRQNSQTHNAALAALLVHAGLPGEDFPRWPEAQRMALLRHELTSPRPFAHEHAELPAAARPVVECHRAIAGWRRSHGDAGLGALIVSMTRAPSDLLVVYLFAREAGLLIATEAGLVCPLPVVPLLETLDDLARGPATVEALLAEPIVRRSLHWQAERSGGEPTLQVMVGYSDSNKDGGLWASRWGLHRAQEAIAAIGSREGVRIRFFHGRGGTIARGAGPIHRFLRALPPAALRGDLRLTEQGEVLAARYADADTAAHHLEQLVASVAGATARHTATVPGVDPLAPALDAIAAHSRIAWRALIDAPDFIRFFREATPIDALEVARIGSRPARRTGQASIDDLRAIPWVFAWNQARFALTGWYGTGAALDALQASDASAYEALVSAAFTHPTLHHLISSVATAHMGSDLHWMRAYAALVTDPALRVRVLQQIETERSATQRHLEHIYGGPLALRRPNVHAPLARRAAALAPLHHLQIHTLAAWRAARAAHSPQAPDLERQLLATVNAIAAGLGATG